jgi:preprotein translocase subunit SecG
MAITAIESDRHAVYLRGDRSFRDRLFTRMFTFLLVVQTLIAATLVGVILMQRSEGGGLGVGGSSSGFMTARGAADFLTRSTAVLGGMFIVLSIALAAYAGVTRKPTKVDTTLVNQAAPVQQAPIAPIAPMEQPNAPAQQNNSVPLAQ